ncbi:hypothetical protein L6205_19420 [Pseudomonas syringae pv. syringae]|uniref:Uncharacterized protein n=2 Tax=Pseudomonas cannabina TaxID=86840 RepID=A0A3M3Q341_PSECA|nr:MULTISPECIES: hypothetical protein [Pseudomonas syringae group]KPW18024.1 Uncharacterized protein ALO83_01972 [Pseudomonas cannabina pv. alisalensis]MBM0141919.1 hypothetical protein [Pseudomonas cannabina pv. alisalensis]MCH5531314.1 hypothetical protein [Pseudomonas syringae pv. syringae]MCH5541375.1 hypothetical protein [Pseudomonas syringae pv. syringae]MCH5546389.1 hypothetical protein [Pseudomonas syringae pv. syringae]
MKREFNNRIDAQRNVLNIVNKLGWREELFGLSAGAIARWVEANQIPAGDQLHAMVTQAAEKLFFLANKSQEQITGEYRALSIEVADLALQIEEIARAR